MLSRSALGAPPMRKRIWLIYILYKKIFFNVALYIPIQHMEICGISSRYPARILQVCYKNISEMIMVVTRDLSKIYLGEYF